MRTTHPDVLLRRLTTDEAGRRLALLDVWRGLWKLFPGLKSFDLGDEPEEVIRSTIATLHRRYERDVSADVAEWLRASDDDRISERRRLRDVVIPRVRALRHATHTVFRIVNDIPEPTPPGAPGARSPLPAPRPFFDIVNQVLASAEMRRAA